MLVLVCLHVEVHNFFFRWLKMTTFVLLSMSEVDEDASIVPTEMNASLVSDVKSCNSKLTTCHLLKLCNQKL
jgi:hypothetical protein